MTSTKTLNEFWNEFVGSLPSEVTDGVNPEYLKMAFYCGAITMAYGANAMLRDGRNTAWLTKKISEIDEYRAEVVDNRSVGA